MAYSVVPSSLAKEPSYKVIHQHPLSWIEPVFLKVVGYRENVYVYLSGVSNQGILMDRDTWLDFSDKILNAHFRYTTDSFVANNSLCLFAVGNGYRLQTLHRVDGNRFQLSRTQLELDGDMMRIVKEEYGRIKQVVLSYLYQDLLSDVIVQRKPSTCHAASHSKEEGQDYLLECICSALDAKLQQVFKCSACIHDNLSQRRHACLLTAYEKFKDPDLLLTLNVTHIGSRYARGGCTCTFERLNFWMEDFTDQVHTALARYGCGRYEGKSEDRGDETLAAAALQGGGSLG